MYLFFHALCCTNPWLMFDEGSCLLLIFMIPAWCDAESSMWCTCCHDLSCYVLRSLCCMLMGYSVCCHVCLHWDPFYAMLAGCSSCMSLCHTDRSILTKISCNGASLGAILAWGNFLCIIATSPICTSSLLVALNAVSYTILTPGPGDVVPPRRTPLSMDYVFMCLWLTCPSSLQHAHVFIMFF